MKPVSAINLKDLGSKVFWITVAWTFISVFEVASHFNEMMRADCVLSPSWGATQYFQGSVITGLLAGLLGGTPMVVGWQLWMRNKIYGKSLLYMLGVYTVAFYVVTFCIGFIFYGVLSTNPSSGSILFSRVIGDTFNSGQLIVYLFWLFVVSGTLFVLMVNDKYGPGLFWSFLLGKYYNPSRQERIFMFLDMRSSTAIAEKLGEIKYFDFVKDTFTHATPAILNSDGEIYQYVGDEIVVSWKTGKGTANANCIKCFFEVRQNLARYADYYQRTYGIIPEFKAGLHYGFVMAGEIGVIKRDIAYSGDVLNTTARIQGKCNELGVNILVSQSLIDLLKGPIASYQPRKMGEIQLRGKQQEVALFTV